MAKKAGRPKKAEALALVKTTKAKAEPSVALVPALKGSALSTEVGPRVANMMLDALRADAQSQELKKSGAAKRYDGLMLMTEAIAKAKRADDSIDLASVFLDAKDVSKARLYNQCYVAMGYKQPVTVKDKARLEWTPGVADIMASKATDPEHNRKESVRTALATQIGKCIQAAIYIVENKATVKADKASGTLQLSGPAIQKHFGEATVLLNEKQNIAVKDKKGNEIGRKELKAKPSFTEIAKLGAESHGKIMTKRPDSRAVTTDVNKYMIDVCGSLVKALEKNPELNEEATTALESLASAIETFQG
jgi:hypothetical protein